MLLNNKKTLPFIKIIENWRKSNDKYATGALIEVTNSKLNKDKSQVSFLEALDGIKPILGKYRIWIILK